MCKAAPTNGVAPYSFLWSTGATIDSIVNLKAGTYTCTITDAAGCTKTQTYTLTQPLQIAIAMSGTPATSPLFNNGTATATPNNGFSPYRYSWNTSPIKTTQTATGLVPGTYVVTVKDNKKCSRNASIVIGTARFGVTDTGEELFVIPNPTSDVISIEISNSVLSGNATFEIIDSKGSVVLMEQSNITSHDFTFSISLAHLPNGIYTLRAKDAKNVFTKTVLLEK
nr:T9SS type A sorting domain-containing protein [Bacteroidota bacterium]